MAGATPLRRLKKRSQFLRAARGNRAGRSAFALQAMALAEGDCPDPAPGVGYTVTKKVGNSPERNRIKRRLREAARASRSDFKPQHDYVIVGRREALSEPFTRLVADLNALLVKVHAARGQTNRAPSPRNSAQ